jgi:hypothetical protein
MRLGGSKRVRAELAPDVRSSDTDDDGDAIVRQVVKRPKLVVDTISSCTFLESVWATKKGECCSNTWCQAFRRYEVDTVLNVRLHLKDKTKAEKKLYLQSRVDTMEDDDTDDGDDAFPGIGRQTERRVNTFWLEHEHLLLARVQKNQGTQLGAAYRQLAACSKPEVGSFNRVCQNFLMFVVGSRNRSNCYRVDKVGKGKHDKIRIGKKKMRILAFFVNARLRYEIQPNSHWVVLPFRTRAQTHAAHVLELEKRPVAELMAMLDREDARSQFETHDAAFDLLRDDEVPEHDARYRYGNPDLGLVDAARPENPDIACLSYFRQVWKADATNKLIQEESKCSNIKVRKELPFTKCTICKEIRKAQLKCKDTSKLRVLSADHRAHVEFVRLERETYWHNRSLAKDYPRLFASITIDAADQSDFHLPHFAEQDKFESSAFKVKTHVVGVLNHGRTPMAFISGNQCKQGHNVTIQAFWESLCALHKDGGIPPTIFLQLDNTSKQNKGKYLVAFCELLVSLKVCKEIKINFLPVGHTHEDIDQFFSRLAILLRRTDALSLEHLAQIIPSSYKSKEGKRPVVKIWNALANVSGWMMLVDNHCNPLSHITEYRLFQITLNDKGRPMVRVKTNMNERIKGDDFRGPSANHKCYPEDSATCWQDDNQPLPDLLRAARDKTIPPSQPSDVDQERLQNHINGLDRLDTLPEHLYPMVHRISNRALLNAELGLAELEFDWDLGDMTAILTPPPAAPAPVAQAKPVFIPPPCTIKKGSYYIIKPLMKAGVGGGKDNYPFYLGLVKGKDDPDADGNITTYRVQWLEPADVHNGATYNDLSNWVDSKYQTRETDTLPASRYDAVAPTEFCQLIQMVGGAASKKRKTQLSIFVEGDHGRRAARAWGIQLGKGRNVNKNFSDYQ